MMRSFIALSALALAACHADTFTATGPSGLELVQGPPAVVSLRTWTDSAVIVRVVDQSGAPVAGVAVDWKILEGDGAIAPAAPLTNAEGVVLAYWRFNLVPGPQVVQVSVANLEPMTIATEAHAFRAIQVTAGYGHGCALDAAHEAWCFGGSPEENGGPPVVERNRPVKVGGGHQFAEIDAGDGFTCGRTATGEVWCWGYNWGGALGSPAAGHSALPLRVTGLPTARLVRTGSMHACALGADSTTWCWGNLSDGDVTFGPPAAPTLLASPLKFVELAPGVNHTCGLVATGEAYCWGINSSSQLGDSGAPRALPTTPVLGGHQFVELKSGDFNSCGRTVEGEVWCWGMNDIYSSPTIIPARLDLPQAYALTVASGFTAVGTLGGNVEFAMPDGGEYTLPAPIRVQGIAAMEGRGGYCLLTRTGDVYCSGSVVDGVGCSIVAPYGCTETGAVPLPTGGRGFDWWDPQATPEPGSPALRSHP